MSESGHLFILIGPGGSGKTAIIAAVQSARPEIRFIPTTTTRPPRPGEVHGREYFFVSEEEFEEMRARNDLLEWERIHGNLYGTSRRRISDLLSHGLIGLTSLDYKGGVAVRSAFPEQTTTIFVRPGSLAELRIRLEARPGSTAQDIDARLLRSEEELHHAAEFDHLITNRNGALDAAAAEVLGIMASRTSSRVVGS